MSKPPYRSARKLPGKRKMPLSGEDIHVEAQNKTDGECFVYYI